MALRHIHYEAAFEDYVRSRGWPYVAVSEHRKAIFGGARIKSFDYLVYPAPNTAWLVEVKGRKFPYIHGRVRRFWENWVTADELKDLASWKGVFGDGFDPVLVFAYWLCGFTDRNPATEIHAFRGEYYAFLWVSASDYARAARRRSPSWGTVTVPTAEFRGMVQSVAAFTG